RMKSYGVRRDRADAMGVAAIIFVVLARYLNIHHFLIPTVGIREGILQEIAREAFSRKEPHRYTAESRQTLLGTRSFARRFEYDQRHAEHVRALSVMLFDHLQPLHHLPHHARVELEAGALLHDIGHRITHRGHHKHGEYLALNGDIPGLEARDLAASLRIAEGLDHSRRQRIQDLRASFQRGAVTIQVRTRGDAAEDIRDAERSSALFEREFH